MISDWDEAETEGANIGHLGGAWTDLDDATGASKGAGAMTDADHVPFLDE